MSDCRFIQVTANRPGAIAIIQLVGDVEPVLKALTGRDDWPLGKMKLVDLAGVDRGLAGIVDKGVAQLMPHGGMRVMQRLIGALLELGCESVRDTEIDPMKLYPEAEDVQEALMLQTLARARSPLAIDLLLDQPGRWRKRKGTSITEEDRARSQRLNRLIDPPSVVLAGPPNVGKSTLSNALLGRSMSIALDMPGTTRDYTTGRIELAGLVVNWYDTPGIRESRDPIEKHSIEIASRLMGEADYLIAITDHQHEWPSLSRDPDLRIANKWDLGIRGDADHSLSAISGVGMAEFVMMVRDALVTPEDLAHPGPWLFDDRLLDL
ncbi:MAG: 50S ribosome-binding GTPase [Planctomycetota bacterium]|nr:50S ribosome-binding GTPase [Planctomycetota bacterium]